jgi:hypothetical protein
LIADEHTETLDELMQSALWEKYGPGQDDRCATCTMHSGYEAGIIQETFTSPGSFLDLAGGFLKGSLGRPKRRDPNSPSEVGEAYNPGD